MATEDLPPSASGNDKKREKELAKIAVRRAASHLDAYTTEQLIALRQQIDMRLPSLKDVNMERELVGQLAVVKELQEDVIGDDGVPANQRAQVAGQMATILATLAKLQIEIHSSERLKKIERCLIDTVNEMPDEHQRAFLARYREQLGALDA